ncbi:uncharacterized protein LOC112591650 [Melanaphis sacchari]|uniref:uncharacterized protein LOC112591650 n=1 Tax=Melanaphis sacchari TaxID=742174 RepID=UPI000DC13418|nr:uncharacterized protein LOC112591650 [Melanaphis sacchari]
MGNDEQQRVERWVRSKLFAEAKRRAAISAIRAIHALALRAVNEPDLVSEFLIAASDLEGHWAQFKSEDESVLEHLINLDKSDDYSADLPTEVRGLIIAARSVADRLTPKGADAIDLSYLKNNLPSSDVPINQPVPMKQFSRLPDIPLPQFDGDYRYWSTFCDAFDALVENRPNICDVDKLHYLMGCLKGRAADAVRGIPLSAQNYSLVRSTLAERFYRPRLVAMSLVDQLLGTSPIKQESLSELNNFMCSFTENMSLLNALNIPDLHSFILFSVAFRCLPVSTRKLFETSTISDYPTIDELMKFIRNRVAVLEIVGEPREYSPSTAQPKSTSQSSPFLKGAHRSGKPKLFSHPTTLVATKLSNPTSNICPCCNGTHGLDTCTRFKSWAVDDRARWTREHKLCFNCFNTGHWAPKCASKSRCQDCSRRHHNLLHPPGNISQRNGEASPSDVVLCASAPPPTVCKAASVLLGTALIHVRDRAGSWQTLRALVDCASQISVITAACVDRLGLRRERWTTPVTGLSGVSIMDVQGRVDCVIQPRYSNEPMLSVQAWVLPSITSDLPRNTLPVDIRDRFSNLALADPSFHITAPIDLLLGGDVYATIMDGRKITVEKNLPVAFSSIFGWILMGSISDGKLEPLYSLPVSLTVSLEGLMYRFWEVEEPEVAPEAFTDNGRCEQIFRDKHVRLPSGRFAVPLPFRAPVSDDTFARSRETALKRFESLERKLATDSKLKSLYKDFMAEYLALGHMSVAKTPGQYYIPHHAICKNVGEDTKIRVVFDASAKDHSGMSLNRALLPGPKLQRDIVDILIRFRLFRHAFTADICKMYRQILILPEFRTYQHILWRDSPFDQVVDYELNTVTYGVNCAPFLALRVLRAIADSDGMSFPRVRDALYHQTYVDDICYGADTITEAVAVQSELNLVLARSGLELRKWSSNTHAILHAMPADHCVVKSMSFADDDSIGTKVLGIHWHPNDDYFSCELRLEGSPTFTKRGILSLTAQFFDPLGFFAPAIFLAKYIMQRTWQTACEWDGPLPCDIRTDWAQFVSQLPQLSTIRIPRFCNTPPGTPCFLYGFCDASLRGYAAVVYLRVINAPRDSSVFLVGTKTKLAPIKPLTVPRLELNAALLLIRWLNRVKVALGDRVNIVDTFAWTDSLVVLSWLTIPHETFKQYVSNRVHQIQTVLPNCHWRYVPSIDNPADCASRGLTPSELPQFMLYWLGPRFIKDLPNEWGRDRDRLPCSDLPEVRSITLLVQSKDPLSEWFTRFSSYDNMIRVVAWMRRFLLKSRRRSDEVTRVLTRDELEDALRTIVLSSQRSSFAELRGELLKHTCVSSKPIARLCPFIDDQGVIRVGGRLKNSNLPFDSKHPILLAKTSYLSTLVCRRWHKLTCHSGPRVMSAMIRRQFWVVSLRSVIYTILTQCTVCVRLDGRNPQPLMGDLPTARVQQCRAFTRVGVDYAGPLSMRELRLRKSRTYKVYIAIFVCFAVKAVHLELVSDLSTEAFMAAFDRFVARRGMPNDVFSDCGTNFVGAARQLRELINSPPSQGVITSTAMSCSWHFNPPAAPHFGGLWEAAVRSAKRLLTRVVGSHVLTYEEFSTVLCRVEAVLNSRPLTPASSDPHDLECLTPGHFLVGQPLLAVPPRSPAFPNRSIISRWKLLNQCHQTFWHRWSAEYLHTLQARVKWTDNRPNVKINDMVVIRDPLAPPLEWRLGRITGVEPGADGVVRVVHVLTSRGVITRPVVKVIVLPIADN